MYERYLPHIGKTVQTWDSEPLEVKEYPSGMTRKISSADFGKYHIYSDEQGTRVETPVDRSSERIVGTSREVRGGVLYVEHTTVALTAAEVEEMRQKEIINAVQAHMDNEARKKGYDDIKSASDYAGTLNEFQAEGEAALKWRAACWAYCYKVLADVKSGMRTAPTAAELVSELPAIVWPV